MGACLACPGQTDGRGSRKAHDSSHYRGIDKGTTANHIEKTFSIKKVYASS